MTTIPESVQAALVEATGTIAAAIAQKATDATDAQSLALTQITVMMPVLMEQLEKVLAGERGHKKK